MNSLPLETSGRADADFAALSPELWPAVLEQLTRIAANWRTCSRPTAFPRPPGAFESGLWCRQPGQVDLIEVIFVLDVWPDRISVRRIVRTEREELPPWVDRPKDFEGGDRPWPIVDL